MISCQDAGLYKRKAGSYCWLFNIGIEDKWFTDHFKIVNRAEEKTVQHMEEILLLLSDSEDIVLLRKRPHPQFLNQMSQLGFRIPQILCPEKEDTSHTITELVLEDSSLLAKLRKYADQREIVLMPYGVTEQEEQLGNVCGMKINGSSAAVSQRTNNKLYAKELIEKLALPHPEGMVCTCLNEITDAWNQLHRTFDRVVIKRPYGASGQGLYLIENRQQLDRALYALKRSKRQEEGWIAEGWYEERQDLNAQLYVHENGTVDVFSIKEQLVKDTVYCGSLFPVSLPDRIMSRYEESMQLVGKELHRDGVRGVVGIDSMLTAQELFPVVDLNVRFTLSTYLSGLPALFKDRCFLARYYRVLLTEKTGYDTLEQQTAQAGIAFDPDKRKGVFFYNHACMEENVAGEVGRLFVVYVAENAAALAELEAQMNQILEKKGVQI